ncbi:MAG: NUDIX hydrolase [archaeon]
MIFDKPPENFKPSFEVATCLIKCSEKYLFVLRSEEEDYPNTWCLPGGKIEDGEADHDTIIREVKEETGINANQVKLKDIFYVRYPDVDFIYHVFECDLEEMPEVKLNNEHSDFKWVTIKEAMKLNLILGESESLRKIFSINN